MTDETVLFRHYEVADALIREHREERVVEAVVVPYGVPAVVSDVPGITYREAFAPDAFSDQLSKEGAAGRVFLRWQHDPVLMSQLGRGVEFKSYPDHLRGRFKIFDGAVGDHALAILNDMKDLGISLGFTRARSREHGGVMIREKALLREVSLTPTPAYPDAKVLAVRDGHLVEVAAATGPPEPPPLASPDVLAIIENLRGKS